MKPVRVLVVDDSAVVRQVVCEILGGAPGLQVIGAVADPLFALARMRHEWPDVIVLDVEMPRMDGLSFLRKLMAERPTPVVICSTRIQEGARTSVEALAAGAVAVLPKPAADVRRRMSEEGDGLVATVRAAAHARLGAALPCPTPSAAAAPPRAGAPFAPGAPSAPDLSGALRAPAIRRVPGTAVARGGASIAPGRAAAGLAARPVPGPALRRPALVAIGASLGGTQALHAVLAPLPADCPPIVIVQHMPAGVTRAFAERLDGLCRITVREARDGDRVLAGQALIAPGGRHMRLLQRAAGWQVEVFDGPPVNRHRPAVDVLFRSVAQQLGARAIGILLTGMGTDGARGLLEMRQAGAHTVAQDEASCVVFGMPRAAQKLGAASAILPLPAIPGVIAGIQKAHS